VITLVKILHNILFAAGYLAIAVLASVISYYGRPELGLGIILTATAVLATLLIASGVVNRRHKRAVQSVRNAEAAPRPDTPRPTARTSLNPTNTMPPLFGR